MRYALVLTAAAGLILAAQTDRPAAQTNNEVAADQVTKASPPLTLSEQDKAAVIKAALEDRSHQKTPKQFTPTVGASVPSAVYQHSFKPEIAVQIPVLEHYYYAYLDREIVLIDSLQKKVVAVIPLPASLVSGGQEKHQGAAESEGESKREDGSTSTDSVPSYTSPESIK
jgi:hypothetical protein